MVYKIVIQNWMRRKDTISYLGVWENLHNPHFNCIEFDAIKVLHDRVGKCRKQKNTNQITNPLIYLSLNTYSL